MTSTSELNRPELGRYVDRAAARWPLEKALLGGARATREPAEAQQGAEYVLVLVSPAFDEVPWLQRVHEAAGLWDTAAMGGRAEMHCYTDAELTRRLKYIPRVKDAVERGIDLLS
jgi:hypothetical protein